VTIIESPFALKTFVYLSIAITLATPTRFLFCYPHLLFFISDFQPLFLSFSVIMKGSVSKEKEKMLKGQSLREVEQDSKLDVTSNKGN
jgi:hypothetical protein